MAQLLSYLGLVAPGMLATSVLYVVGSMAFVLLLLRNDARANTREAKSSVAAATRETTEPKGESAR